ncbi:MAG: hypothetical protein QW783_04215 [Candidatus Micrarchaeia archaeon]
MLTQLRTNILDSKNKRIQSGNFLIETRLVRSFGLESRVENIIVSTERSRSNIKKKRRFR